MCASVVKKFALTYIQTNFKGCKKLLPDYNLKFKLISSLKIRKICKHEFNIILTWPKLFMFKVVL